MGNNIARRDRLGKQKEKMRSEEEPRSSRRRNPAKSYYAKSTTRHTDKSKLPHTNFSACGMLDVQVPTSFMMSRKTKNRKGSVNEFSPPDLEAKHCGCAELSKHDGWNYHQRHTFNDSKYVGLWFPGSRSHANYHYNSHAYSNSSK